MKLHATLQSDQKSEELKSSDFIDIYLKCGNKAVGILSLTSEVDADGRPKQYLLRWYPRGWPEHADNPVVILKEGHAAEGTIQELTEE